MTAALSIPVPGKFSTVNSNSLGSSATDVDVRTLTILAFSATAGVLVEFYDFAIFGFAAASAFPNLFFPKLPPTQALIFSYLAYAAGHPARLLGAFIFGHFGDKSGRKFAFLINIVVVGASTCLTGLLPGYRTIGIAAPILLVLLRIIQGIGVGGEFGGATSLLAVFGAKRRSRAFWMPLANLGLALGIMSASGMFLLLRNSFTTSGWRLAMLFSAVIVIPALVVRYKLSDSPLFQQLKQRQQLARLPSFGVFRRHAAPILLLAAVSAFQSLDTAVTGTYIVSFMHLAGIPLATAAIIIFLSRFADVTGVLLSGPLADICKRRRLAYFAIAATMLVSYPFALAIVGRHIVLAAVLQCLIVLFGMGLLHGLVPILTSETFPTRFRYSGAGISYGLSGILAGMIAPALLARLIGQDVVHRWHYLPAIYAIYGAAAMIALLFIRETRNIRLEDLDGLEVRDAAKDGHANHNPSQLVDSRAMKGVGCFVLVLCLALWFANTVHAQENPLQAPPAVTSDPAADPEFPATMGRPDIPSHGAKVYSVIYIASGAGPHPTVLMLHGFPGNEKNLDLAYSIRRAGWNVLVPFYRGAWGSGGTFSFTHALEDAQASIDFLRAPENAKKNRIDSSRIVVLGHSMGGFVAAYLTAHDPQVLA